MPRIVDRTERRQALTHAALAVFAERGYHGATMEAVANRAGVSKGSIYDYFRSKDELLLGTAETLLTALFDQSLGAFEASTGPLRGRIGRLVESVVTSIDEWTDVCFSLLQVWAELGPQNDEPLRTLMANLYRRSATRIQGVFDESVGRGEVAAFPTRAAALAIMASVDGMLLQAIIVRDEFREAVETGLFVRWCASIIPEGGEEKEPS